MPASEYVYSYCTRTQIHMEESLKNHVYNGMISTENYTKEFKQVSMLNISQVIEVNRFCALFGRAQ